jgi:peptidoglycan/LPS O-acetylase OafA/YrhL
VSTQTNNFDPLRFWAAMAVLWSHTVPLTQGSEHNELMFRLSRGQTTSGTVAVFVFFAISGYLITRSFERAASPWHFARARVLRIMPGLLAVLVLTAFVIGPLVTSESVRSYFSASEPYRYLALQSSLFFGRYDFLPGVFSDNPLTNTNGPVWTLRFEAEFYGLVFLLGIFGLLRREVTLGLYLLALVALALLPVRPGTDMLPPVPNAHLNLGAGFLAGALIYHWKVPLSGRIAVGCLLLTLLCMLGGQMQWAQRTFVPYLVLYLAIGPSMARVPHPWAGTDVSYGLYIWAWPITQLVLGALGALRWWQAGLMVTPLALAAGWLSWTLVEKRALTLKDLPLFGRSTAPPQHAEPPRHAHG